MVFDGFNVTALVDALGLHRAPAKRTLPSGFGQTAQARLRIGCQQAQHAVQIAIIERESGPLQVVVVSENLLRSGHIAGCALELYRVRAQVNGDVQAVFEQAEIFVSCAEQGFDVGDYINTFFHSIRRRILQAPLRLRFAAHCVQRALVAVPARTGFGRRMRKFFWVEMEPAEMLATGVEATAIG